MWFWNVSWKFLLEVSATSYTSFITSFNSPITSGPHILQQPLPHFNQAVSYHPLVFATQLITYLLYLPNSSGCRMSSVIIFSVTEAVLSLTSLPSYKPPLSHYLFSGRGQCCLHRLHKEPEFTDKCSLPPVLVTLHSLCLKRLLMSWVRLFQVPWQQLFQ